MQKGTSPLVGFNNNVRHKSRVFHVQTEDSGIKHPHIITHLFMDGGRILKSVKTSYAEHVGADNMVEVVRQMMQDQHKAMLTALRDGQFDELVEAFVGKGRESQAGERPSSPEAVKAEAAPPPPPPQPAAPPPIPTETRRRTLSFGAVRAPDPTPTLAAAPAVKVPPPAASGEMESFPRTSPSVLPPPPDNLLREKATSGGYRSNTSSTEMVKSPSAPPARPSRPPVVPSDKMPAAKPASERRYAAARPAAIFAQASPQKGKSIFGQELSTEKSLDEVILTYLAEDLDTAKK